MLNNCFSYSFIKCNDTPSDARTLDGVFNTLSNMDLYSMFDNPQEAINIATELAYNSMTTALISKEGKSINKYNEILGERFTDSYSSIGEYTFESSKKQFIRLNKVYVNVNYTGTINLRLENELAQIELVPIDVVSGVTKEVVLNKDFRYVEVDIVEDVEGRVTYSCGMNGILIDYSVLCDYNIFICANKELFQTCMDYKVASILLTDGQFSGEVGKRLMQSNDYDNLNDAIKGIIERDNARRRKELLPKEENASQVETIAIIAFVVFFIIGLVLGHYFF